MKLLSRCRFIRSSRFFMILSNEEWWINPTSWLFFSESMDSRLIIFSLRIRNFTGYSNRLKFGMTARRPGRFFIHRCSSQDKRGCRIGNDLKSFYIMQLVSVYVPLLVHNSHGELWKLEVSQMDFARNRWSCVVFLYLLKHTFVGPKQISVRHFNSVNSFYCTVTLSLEGQSWIVTA